MTHIGFELIKDFSVIKSYYGYIPETADAPNWAIEQFPIDEEDVALLCNDFVEPIDKACGSLLDCGDVDYFDVEQCEKLKNWLDDRLTRPCPDRLCQLYDVLLDYASRAIDMRTGLVIEL